jgi:hypothetical protein
MFDDAALEEAIEIQRRCYRLLRWVDTQIASGELVFFAIHGPIDEVQAAEAWLHDVYRFIPGDARPPRDEKAVLHKYANYFTSYVLASIEIEPNPGARAQPGLCGCTCSFCLRLSQASHTRSRPVGSGAKLKATAMSVRALLEVASQMGSALTEEGAESMMRDPEVRRNAAVVAYARDLLHRVEGISGNESSLALWRRFAYTPTGAPIKGFELTLDTVHQAIHSLERCVRAAAG